MPKEKKTESLPKSENDNKDEMKTTPPVKKTVRRKRKAPAVAKVKDQEPVTEDMSEKVQEKKLDPSDAKDKQEQLSEPSSVATQPKPKPPQRAHQKVSAPPRRHSIDLSEIKPTTKYLNGLKGKRPIVGLTAYDAIMSKLIAKAGVDFILVGDSVGTTLLGYDTTIPVTIDDMVHHTSAVRRGNPGCLVVADLPFGEASFSFDRLLESSRRLMQNGADAVKIEGGKDVADDIEKLVATGIPVMGHIGLLPQTVKAIGGYRKYGASREEADSLYTDAISLEEAGCFAVIGEMMDERLTVQLASQILPPLIGIGSGSQCDGQILVTHDLLGLTPSPLPSFVTPCATLGLDGLNALTGYVQKIRSIKSGKR